MPIIIKLKGLPLEATSVDVRRHFLGLTIPDGGVHIIGGDEGIVFIEFASDEDARQAMSKGDGKIKNSNIKLLLSSQTEMVSSLEIARQNQNIYNNSSNSYPNNNNNQPICNVAPFEGDPRMLSQNYQGIINQSNKVASQQQISGQFQQNQQQHQLNQQQQQQQQQCQDVQQQNQQHMPSAFVDPRILSQSYLGLMPGQTPQTSQPQHLLMPPVMVPPNIPPFLGMLGGIDLGAVGGLNPNGINPLDANNSNSGRNLSPDNKARISGMRGGDDKLFANKRCVLAASNIPYRATSKDIIEFLSEFNLKEDCIRRRYNAKGQPTADAKIAFPTPDAAMKAMKMMNKKSLCGRPVFLKPV